jgi:hypothetical protein
VKLPSAGSTHIGYGGNIVWMMPGTIRAPNRQRLPDVLRAQASLQLHEFQTLRYVACEIQ